MSAPPLPPLEFPPDALLLFEEIIVDNPDRSGGWRFYVSADGGFYNARNDTLFVDDGDLQRTDAALFWNKSFPDIPQRRFAPEAMQELETALDRAVPTLERSEPWDERVEIVERWTVARNGAAITAVVARGERPRPLNELRQTIDRLTAAAAPA